MNISDNGVKFIKRFEGCRLKAYKAVITEKYWTIGYGHYGSDVKEGQVITQAEADRLLLLDLKRFVDGVNKVLKATVNQNQFDALVSFAYNCGLGALQSSTLLALVNQKEFEKASLEFDKWNKSGGVVLKGLQTRRSEERALFNSPTGKTETKEGSEEKLNLSGSLQQITLAEIEKMADEKVHGSKAISKSWVDKFKKGELTQSEAIGLLFVAKQRGI